MARYLISFNEGAMDHIPAEEMADAMIRENTKR